MTTQNNIDKQQLKKYLNTPKLWAGKEFPFKKGGYSKYLISGNTVYQQLVSLAPGQVMEFDVLKKPSRVRYANGDEHIFDPKEVEIAKENQLSVVSVHSIALTVDTKGNMLIFDPSIMSLFDFVNDTLHQQLTGFHQGLPNNYDDLLSVISGNSVRLDNYYAHFLNNMPTSFLVNVHTWSLLERHKLQNNQELPELIPVYSNKVVTTVWW